MLFMHMDNACMKKNLLKFACMHGRRPRGTGLRMRGLYEDISSAAAALLLREVDTLVVYTYSRTDPEYERNLAFFVSHGMWDGDGCDYLIIVQQVSDRLFPLVQNQACNSSTPCRACQCGMRV